MSELDRKFCHTCVDRKVSGICHLSSLGDRLRETGRFVAQLTYEGVLLNGVRPGLPVVEGTADIDHQARLAARDLAIETCIDQHQAEHYSWADTGSAEE